MTACDNRAVGDTESGWERRRHLLLTKYERVAWELFAARGFQHVTVDEIAEATGVSTRTLFRYFPTKEDFLLGYPRRGIAGFVEMVARLEPCPTPLEAGWQQVRDYYLRFPLDPKVLTLWRRAAAEAPEVHARVRGERTHALTEAFTAFCAACPGADPTDDVRPRVLAGVLVGMESAVVELWGRSRAPLGEILDAAERSVPGLGVVAAGSAR
jgi:TetR/AcrR family transcriptional regulator, regulator of mycofactocin system